MSFKLLCEQTLVVFCLYQNTLRLVKYEFEALYPAHKAMMNRSTTTGTEMMNRAFPVYLLIS